MPVRVLEDRAKVSALGPLHRNLTHLLDGQREPVLSENSAAPAWYRIGHSGLFGDQLVSPPGQHSCGRRNSRCRSAIQFPDTTRLALAHHVEALIAGGELAGLADAAKRLGLTRARMTQIADLALLTPEIQSSIALGEVSTNDRQLREVLKHTTWRNQRRAFEHLSG
ncbi:MAG: hypothetical protein ACI8UD_000200 [Planctomycetota bacterium]|jgi:hypothetical protein